MNYRGLTSYFATFGFLIMAITGLVLYITPQGRVAYWVHWEFVGLTKDHWGNVHILASLLFIVAGIFHIYFNWKPLLNYLRDKVSRGLKMKRELVISGVISILVVVSGLFNVPPLSYLLDLNAWAKDAWIVERAYEPPFGHAELLPLSSFAQKMDIPLDDAVRELKANEIELNSARQTLEEIAINNGITPMEVYLLIKHLEAPVEIAEDGWTEQSIEVEFSGSGLGNRTIPEMCDKGQVSVEEALKRLLAAGVMANETTTFKDLATEYGGVPMDYLKVILLPDYQLPDRS